MRNQSSRVLYLGTDSNRVLVVKEGKVIQSIHPVAPNPLGLPEGVYNGVATEWISRHPEFPVLYALTSYWNASPACVTSFRIDTDGRLVQLAESSSTGGLHAAHATFSPDGSLFVIAHHNDGKLVFFDSTNGKAALPQNPLLVIQTPVVIPGTQRKTGPKDAFLGLPSLHHVQYSPNHKFLLTVDPSQDHVFTYTVNERGLPISQQPTSKFKCYSDVPIYGLFQRLITKYVLKCKRRARKAVIHPNGRFIYVLYESINRVQVYSIGEDGIIDGTQCCQDITTLDPSFVASTWSPVGLALQLAAELYITNDGSTLFVSNRGDKKLPGSRAESSVRVFSIQQEGRQLKPEGALPYVFGPVRHLSFLTDNTEEGDATLVAAVCQSNRPHLQYFQKEAASTEEDLCSNYVVSATTNVPANVFCISH